MIAFSSPPKPPVRAAGNSIPGIAQWNFAELPKVETLKGRGGAPLNTAPIQAELTGLSSWCTDRAARTCRC
jgi:hypothetical protein